MQDPRVDRVACPWLIKRFVDPAAEFLYVPTDRVMAVAKHEGAIPFDMENVELGHDDRNCSFDAIIKKYNLVYQNDHELLERETPVYDALYAYCQGLVSSKGN